MDVEGLAMKRLIPIAGAVFLVLVTTTALAASKTEKRMDAAIEVIQEFTRIPEQGIPPRIMNNAYGVAVIPGVIKIGMSWGARFGKGIIVVRQEDGSWSNPAFITLGGGSFGLQIGAQSTDLVLVFKDRRSVEYIVDGKMTLGADASAAAGPVGRQTSAATDHLLTAEIYSYSRNRGLFAGMAIEGAWLSMDRMSNEQYYGNGMSPQQILDAENMPTPISATQFIDILTASTPRIRRDAGRVARATPQPEPAQVQTYAIDPVPEAGDETTF
jgi:lipid-binding SYLF domain-containing protein